MAEKGGSRARRLHCAIYTRKSSDEGLEQEFNSLHAQREACEAFIASQRHEGWHVLSAHYDDGGYSGGTMDRPALQQLLADIGAGKVDVVVVYKIDRLTRSLFDFAKIVETFDAKEVSFVSITQAFALDLVGAGPKHFRDRLSMKYPTAGLAVINFASGLWKSVGVNSGTLNLFLSPKDLRA